MWTLTEQRPSGQYVRVPRLVQIGYWRGETAPNHPDPYALIDADWDEGDRQLVIAYLRSGTIPWVGGGVSVCRICGASNGSAEFTDGTYVWPEGLAHYVEQHHVRLPEPILEHIRRRWDELLDLAEVDDQWWLDQTERR